MIDVFQWRSSIGLWCCHQISYNKRCRNDYSLAETGGAARSLTEQSGCKNLLSALSLILFFSFLLILSGDIESNPGPETDVLKKIPDPHVLLEKLDDINNKWDDIGLALSIPQNVIDDLKRGQDNNNIKLFKVINQWIETMPSPVTWETVISALEGPIVSNKKKADDIRQYLAIAIDNNSVSSEKNGTSTSSPTSLLDKLCQKTEHVPELAIIAMKLKEEFCSLLVAVQVSVNDHNLRCVKLSVRSMIVQNLSNVSKSIQVYGDKLSSVATVDELFNFLIDNRFLGYLNYGLLKVINRQVDDSKVKEQLDHYESEYKHLLNASSFSLLMQVFHNYPDLSPTTAVGLPEVMFRLESPWPEKSMLTWHDYINDRFPNWAGSLAPKEFSFECIIVTYTILPSVLPAIVKDLQDPDVLKELQHIGVTIVRLADEKYNDNKGRIGFQQTSKTSEFHSLYSIIPEKAVPVTPALALNKLKEQLICAICLDLYTNPKSLPCFHSFCLQCLEGLPQDPQEDKYFISCPTCRHHVQLPEPTGAADFPAAFHINNLKEIYYQMIKVSEHQQVTCNVCTTTNATGYCKKCVQFFCQKCIDIHKKFSVTADHKITCLNEVTASFPHFIHPIQKTNCQLHENKPLEIFCETCQVFICQHCTVRIHKYHDYDLVSDCYPKHCQKLRTSLETVSKNITAVTNVLTLLADRENEIKEQGEVVKKEIHVMVEEMIDIIHQSERQLTREVDAITDSKLQELSKQKKPAEKILDHLKDCQEFVEQSLEIDSPQQLVTSTTQMMKRMSDVTKKVNIEEFTPKEKADVHFIKNSSIFNTLSYIGGTVHLSPSVLEKCKVRKIGQNQIATTDKTVTFPLAIQCSDSSLLTVPLSSISCSVVPVGTATPIKATITTTTQPGVYTIHCSHINRGRYNVDVNINGVHIEGTSLVIPFNPYLDNITPLYTIPELKRPCGIAFTNNGSIIVSERNGHRVTILDRDGEQVNAIGHKSAREIVNVSLTFPCGVAITPDNFILVADNHKIQKISMDGECIASFGRLGKGPLEFNIPCGITISPLNGHIYIADYNNHRIQVLESDLTFSCEFGTEGSAEAQLKQPRTVAIDSKGLVYVADTYNNRIQKFTPEGEFLCQIGEQGAGPGQLHHPSGIAIDDNSLLYVTELGNHRVTIFTTDGHFKRSFGRQGSREDQFKHPCEIKFDKDGYLYVCDYDNNRLVVY